MTAARAGPLPTRAGALAGRLIEPFYALAVTWRNRRFDAGRGVVRLDVPVISVGNLSVGGTGKTPLTAWLARSLAAQGAQPAIAMRGYRGGAGGAASDEAQLYAALAPGVPVAVGADRVAAVGALRATPAGREVDCVLLDDGFQHRRLARDLDLVLIDASRDPFGDRLLPAGWLREGVTSLRRAGAVIITHAEAADDQGGLETLQARIADAHGREAMAVTEHAWTGLEIRTRGAGGEPGAGGDAGGARAEVAFLAGRGVVAVSAIGNPGAFLRTARGVCRVLEAVTLRDHDPYEGETVQRIIDAARRAGASAILTTGKDWTKLARIDAERWPCPVVTPVLELVFRHGEGALLGLARQAALPSAR